jgi:ribokinase
MAKRPQVTVLGSLNMDISVTVPRLPGPGMTVLGSAATFTPGGKGANQAVAAARLGADVRMTGCVGDDDFGRQLLDGLRDGGVDGDGVRVVAGAATGLAMISVDESGENIITVAPGANHEVGNPEVDRAVGRQHDVLVISAEIPVLVIRSALAAARGTRFVLNLAPAPPEAAAIVADGVDWLVVNESEAAAILGQPVDGLAGAAQAAAALVTAGARCAVVTAGAHGAALAGRDSALDGVTSIPAFRHSGLKRSIPSVPATRSSAPSRSPWRQACQLRRPSVRPPPLGRPPPLATAPRPGCRAPPTSRPPPG